MGVRIIRVFTGVRFSGLSLFFSFVLEVFKSYGYDVLLEVERFDYLRNNGVLEADLKKITLELDR